MPPSPWHYPRTDLAERVLAAFVSGGSTALTLFAPRRTGKTQFLVHDLGPAAGRAGLAVVYASFWQTTEAPQAILAHAIGTAIDDPGLWRRARDGFARLKPKLRVAPMGIGGEIDLTGSEGIGAVDPLLALDDLIGRLPASYDKPALFMLDEVQGLAAPEHAGFVAALRTSLDKRRDRLRTIFTGSSLEGLRAIFSDREAPFFHFATEIDLPPLDGRFVRHMLDAFETATGRAVAMETAEAFFERVDRSPFLMRGALERMALDPGLDFEDAAERLLVDLAERQGFVGLWADLPPLPRAVLAELAAGNGALTSTAARTRVGAALGEGPVSAGRISGALRTLGRRRLLHKIGGSWAFQDPEFARFVARTVG